MKYFLFILLLLTSCDSKVDSECVKRLGQSTFCGTALDVGKPSAFWECCVVDDSQRDPRAEFREIKKMRQKQAMEQAEELKKTGGSLSLDVGR